MAKDVFTNDNIHELHSLLNFAAHNPAFSDPYRAICRATVDAIEQAIADDAAVNARLQLALDSWKLATDGEVLA